MQIPQVSPLKLFSKPESLPPEQEESMWRQRPLRYIGYVDEMGEVFAPYIGHKAVMGAYLISAFYGLLDLGTCAAKVPPSPDRKRKMKETVIDGMIFHAISTVLMPPMLLRLVRTGMKRLLKQPQIPARFKQFTFLPSLVALMLLPVVGKPIDNMMNNLLNWTYRAHNKKRDEAEAAARPVDVMQGRIKPPSVTIKTPPTFQQRFLAPAPPITLAPQPPMPAPMQAPLPAQA